MVPENRAAAFCERFGVTIPILLAPMAGVSAPSLSAGAVRAGGIGALGALLMGPDEIRSRVREVRAVVGRRDAALQLNLWVPDPPPARDERHEAATWRGCRRGPASPGRSRGTSRRRA
jgi:nitronate monooxygenase